MKLSSFEGGLSTRIDASLIAINEAVVYENIDNATLLLKPVNDFTLLNENITGYPYKYRGKWLSSDGERSYVERIDFLYYTEKNKQPLKTDGDRTTLLGIKKPITTLNLTYTDPIDGAGISATEETVQYVYTYYNSQDDIESMPSDLSIELVVPPNKVVNVSNFISSDNSQVDTIRLYRLGADTTTMTLVVELENGVAEFIDNVKTLDLLSHILDSYSNGAPPERLQNLTYAYGMLFGSVGDTLYFSTIGGLDYWPPSNQVKFSDEITGILLTASGLLIFSKYRTDLLTGTKIDDFSILFISSEQGCLTHSSCKIVGSNPVWVSTDGICSYGNGVINVITKEKLGKIEINCVNSAVYDEVYYVCLADGSLLAVDTRFGLIFKKLKFSNTIDNIVNIEDTLYGRVGDELVSLFTGKPLSFTYLSPVLTESEHSVTKLYGNIYIRSKGELKLFIFIDGKEVVNKILNTDDIHDVQPPQQHQRGKNIQFKFSGTGTVYEIEYKVVGRQNGR